MLEQAKYSVFIQDWDFRGSFVDQMHRANLRGAAHAGGDRRPPRRARPTCEVAVAVLETAAAGRVRAKDLNALLRQGATWQAG